MFGLGWAEIMVAAVVGLIVIGPKELPAVFRKIGQLVGKAKGMAREFSRAMNDAADESGMKDTIDSMNSLKDGVRSVTDPTTSWNNFKPGSETPKPAEEQAKKSKKIQDAMSVKANVGLDKAKVSNETEETYVAPKKVDKSSSKNSTLENSIVAKAPAKPTVYKETLAKPIKVGAKRKPAKKTSHNPGKAT